MNNCRSTAAGIAVFMTVILLAFAMCGCGESEYTMTAIVTVDLTRVLEDESAISPDKLALIPESGLLLDGYEVGFNDGDSASDIIIRALKSSKLQYELDSPETSPYIVGVGNIYALDAGELSGWLVYDGEELLPVGIGEYLPQDGADIRLLYTCDYMKEFGF